MHIKVRPDDIFEWAKKLDKCNAELEPIPQEAYNFYSYVYDCHQRATAQIESDMQSLQSSLAALNEQKEQVEAHMLRLMQEYSAGETEEEKERIMLLYSEYEQTKSEIEAGIEQAEARLAAKQRYEQELYSYRSTLENAENFCKNFYSGAQTAIDSVSSVSKSLNKLAEDYKNIG